MEFSVATLTIVGVAPYTQSRMHSDPKLKGEGADAYDERTWRSKLTTEERNKKPTVVIPAYAIKDCLTSAAKYSKQQIPGQGKATWTGKFTSGVMLPMAPSLNIDPNTVNMIEINANSDGIRGSGKRVKRRFPNIPSGWTSTFEIYILDPIITQSVFHEMAELAGMFIGIGQYRPEKGGTNGRFAVKKLAWEDNRRLVA